MFASIIARELKISKIIIPPDVWCLLGTICYLAEVY
jgi:hypothetical protein